MAGGLEPPRATGPGSRLDQAGVEPDGLVVARRREGDVSAVPGHPAEVLVDLGHVRPGLERMQEIAAGPVEEQPALVSWAVERPACEEAGPIDPGRDLVGVDAKRVAEGGLRVRLETQRREGLAAVHVGLRQVGIGGQGEVELGERLDRTAGRAKRDAQPVSRLGQVGRDLECVLEGHLGALPVALGEVAVASADLLHRTGMGRGDHAGREGKGEEEEGGERAFGHVPAGLRAAGRSGLGDLRADDGA